MGRPLIGMPSPLADTVSARKPLGDLKSVRGIRPMGRIANGLRRELKRPHDEVRDSQLMSAVGGVLFGLICAAAVLSCSTFGVNWLALTAFLGFSLLHCIHFTMILLDKPKHVALTLGEGICLLVFGIASAFVYAINWGPDTLIPLSFAAAMVVAGVCQLATVLRILNRRT